MSQNDLTIANQGFASFRTDLNSALQALGSTNSGTSAPSTTFANQLFYDTTNNILKIRNEDNDAFISLFTLDQTNDNIESLTVNGLITSTTLNVTGAITSSAGATITTADNSTQLTLVSTDTDASVGPSLNLSRDNSSAADNDLIGNIQFNADDDGNNQTKYSEIFCKIADASNGSEDGRLHFNVLDGGSNREFMRMSGSEGIVINEEGDADLDFRVESDASGYGLFLDAGSGHVGIHAVPTTTSSVYKGIQTGLGGTLLGRTDDTPLYLSSNVTYTDNWKYLANTTGSQIALGTNIRFYGIASGTAGNTATLVERATITNTGLFQIHTEQASSYALDIRHEGNTVNAFGIYLQIGSDNATGTNYAMNISDGDGTNQGFITFSSGTVTYGAFTAHHQVIIPDADNDQNSTDNAYPYGTLLEITNLSYTQKNGANSERGILYNVQKSSSAKSKAVIGAYGSSMNGATQKKDADDDSNNTNYTNLHQALVLGDGHILCNNENGNIAIGDYICTSSTSGEGMKATSICTTIGIAREAVTFSNSTAKLVAVEYGYRQFIPEDLEARITALEG